VTVVADFAKDFFYICPIHLKDRGFCSPIVDSEKEAAKKKEEALAREIERVKQEYEEKQRKKKEKEEKEKEKEKGEGSKEKEDKDTTKAGGKGDDAQHTEKEKNDKVRTPSRLIFFFFFFTGEYQLTTLQIDSIKKAAAESKPDDSPRIFALHKYVTSHDMAACKDYFDNSSTDRDGTELSIRCVSTGSVTWRLPRETVNV